MIDLHPTGQYFYACAIGTLLFFLALLRWSRGELDHIPTVGFKSPLLSYIGAIRFLFDAQGMVQEGYDKYKDSIFKLPDLHRWTVVVSGSKFIEELRQAPEEVLSFAEATDETLQIPYTLGARISENPYHIPIIQTHFTRKQVLLFPVLREEVVAAFEDIISLNGYEWSKYPASDTVMPVVCRASNRLFVGSPLCREPDFMDVNIKFTITVVKNAAFLAMLPEYLRPLGSYLFSSVSASIDRAAKHLKPIIEDRLQRIGEHGKDYPDKPIDMLSWLIDEAKGDELTVRNLTRRILTINFAAIHTSTMAFTHVLYYLAAHPEYARILREEVEEVVNQLGWTKNALNQMRKVDSFIKESQRLNALACLMMGRKVRAGFTFSDGTYVPPGTFLFVATHLAHTDDTNYVNPTTFEPFRFVKEQVGRKLDMVSTHTDFLAFGHGKHACPGRFFAANELKLMLAHIVITYDVKLDGQHPKNVWVASTCVPNPKGEVMFRRRKQEGQGDSC